jgi:DNA polymerase
MIVCLGATAAQSLLGTAFRVLANRGERVRLPADGDVRLDPEPVIVATVHPSSVLRARDDRDAAFKSFVGDLHSARAASERLTPM